MPQRNPFSQEVLEWLFEADPLHSERLRRRESTTLELKENFSLASDAFDEYAKVMASFANRDGGYVIFGIKNAPRVMQGMANDKFLKMDPNRLAQELSGRLAPTLTYHLYEHRMADKTFGLIYVEASPRKPVVCLRNGKEIREGEIYYRYNGESRTARASEVHAIVEQRVQQETTAWRDLLARTASVNPSATYLLDVNDGRAQGQSGSFVIGPELLEKVHFIQEGRFTEGGEPTLRVVGEVQVAAVETVATPVPVPVETSRTYPWTLKMIKNEINSRCREETVTMGNLQCVRQLYDVDANEEWFYKDPVFTNRAPQYSDAFLEWLIDQHVTNRDFFADCSERVRASRRRTSTADSAASTEPLPSAAFGSTS